MTELEQIKAQLAAMQAENNALRAAMASKLTIKVSKNGAVSVYGLQRWPVTLYAGQWERLLSAAQAIRQFIAANKSQLATKESDTPETVPSLAQHQAMADAAGYAR